MKKLIALGFVVCAVLALSSVDAATERTVVFGVASCGQAVRQVHTVKTKRVKGCSGVVRAAGCSSARIQMRARAVRIRAACPGGVCP